MVSTPSITAIVPVRGGSRRLPGKNAMKFRGTPLVAHKVGQLRQVSSVSRIVVASDDNALLSLGARVGATPLKQTDAMCDEDNRPWNATIHDIVSRVEGDIILWAHATNPCISPATYQRAIECYLLACTGEGAMNDSLVSVAAVKKHAWYLGLPLNHDGCHSQHAVGNDLFPVYWQDGGIFIYDRARALANLYVYGAYPVLFEMPEHEVADIDTAADWERAVALYRE